MQLRAMGTMKRMVVTGLRRIHASSEGTIATQTVTVIGCSSGILRRIGGGEHIPEDWL
jgi:hypothetical protein